MLRVTSNNVVSRAETESKSIVDKVLDKIVGTYVDTLLNLDLLDNKLAQAKDSSSAARVKYAAFAPFYQTLAGGLSGAAIGLLQTIEKSAGQQTVAQILARFAGPQLKFYMVSTKHAIR